MINLTSETTEQSLLMCIIRSPRIYDELKFLVKAEHFSFLNTKKLFNLITEWINLYQSMEIFNSMGYSEFISYVELNHSEWFFKNKDFLKESSLTVIDSDQANEKWRYFYSLLEKYYLASVFSTVLDNTKKNVEQTPLNIKESIKDLQSNITRLYSGMDVLEADTSLENSLKNYTVNLVKRMHEKYSPAYFGIKFLDEMFGGFFPNTYNLITARSSVGKSALVLTTAKNMVTKQGKKVAVFNLEMNNFDFLSRWFSQDLKISSRYLRNPAKSLTQKQRDDLLKLQDELLHNNADQLHLIDNIYDCSQIIDKILNIYNTYGLDVVFVDLIEYVSTRKRFENRTRELAYISNEFFQLKKKIDVSIVMVQQQNKSGDNKVEQGSGRGSEDPYIQSDASIGLFKKQLDDGSFDPDRRVVTIMKNRHGETGSYEVKFNKDLVMFEDDSFSGALDQ